MDVSAQSVMSWHDAENGPQSMVIGPDCRDVGIERAVPIRRGGNYQHRRNYEGHYWCAGSGRHVWYESMTEYTALMYLDHTERLSAVASQPVCFHFADASRHYPDFFALHESGEKVMYDVRPLALVDKTAEEQFAKTSEACERIGWGYAVLHGVSGAQRHNLEWVAAYRHPWNSPTADDRERLLAFLDVPQTLGDAARLLDLKHPERRVNLVYHLMWQQEIAYDDALPLNWSTSLRRSDD